MISNVQQPQQPVSGQLTVTSDGKPDSAPVSIAADEALETRPAAVPDWGKLTSTPTPCSTANRYSVLASAADDELAGQQFETVGYAPKSKAGTEQN